MELPELQPAVMFRRKTSIFALYIAGIATQKLENLLAHQFTETSSLKIQLKTGCTFTLFIVLHIGVA